jgi:hypothetical protein
VKLVVRFGSLRCLNKRAVGGIVVLPPFIFISRWIVQNFTIHRLIKRNGGSIVQANCFKTRFSCCLPIGWPVAMSKEEQLSRYN